MQATWKRPVVLAGVLVTATALAAASIGLASDHLDGPLAIAHRPADVTDVFAFTSPEDPSRVVLALAVTPYATDASTFSSSVKYVFRVRRVVALEPLTLDDAVLDVQCTSAGTTMSCAGPAGTQGSAVVGQTNGGAGAMRVFAGLRSDPAFFDRQGALATLATGRTQFTGQNAFAGSNVLAIVVELPAAAFRAIDAAIPGDAVAPSPVLAVTAETIQQGS